MSQVEAQELDACEDSHKNPRNIDLVRLCWVWVIGVGINDAGNAVCCQEGLADQHQGGDLDQPFVLVAFQRVV